MDLFWTQILPPSMSKHATYHRYNLAQFRENAEAKKLVDTKKLYQKVLSLFVQNTTA